MKRLLLVLVAALGVMALAAGVGTAGDTKGPPCMNFLVGDGGYSYNSTTDSGTVQATMTLARPACSSSTFRLDIYDFAGTTLLVDDVAPQSVTGDTVFFSQAVSGNTAPPDGVCLVVESVRKGKVADRAPDTGCFAVPANESPGQGGFG